MKWQTLSDAYTAPNGYVVRPLGDTDETEAMGRTLRNGLMVSGTALNPYPGLCVRGLRQILQVEAADGTVVAGSFVELYQGALRSRFVRGENNADITDGPVFDAVSAYVTAVNSRKLPLGVDIDGFEFVLQPPPAPDFSAEDAAPARKSLWSRAGEAFGTPGEGFISRFRRFVELSFREPVQAAAEVDVAPVAEAIPFDRLFGIETDVALPALTGPYVASYGITVEPVASRNALRILGEVLENNLIVSHGRNIASNAVESGRSQFLMVSDDRGPLAYAELGVMAGQVVVTASRGRFEADVNADVARALLDYARAVNSGKVPTNFRIGAGEFLVSQQVLESNPFADGGVVSAPSARLPAANRTQAAGGYSPDDEGDYSPDDEGGYSPDDEGEDTVDPEESWTPMLREVWTSTNGYRFAPIHDGDGLEEAGLEVDDMEGDIEACCEKRAGLFAVSNGDGEDVGVVTLLVDDGVVSYDTFMTAGENGLEDATDHGGHVAIGEMVAAFKSGTLQLSSAFRTDTSVLAQAVPADAFGADWPVLADDYTASNGMVVVVVGQESRLKELGELFHNALSDSGARRMWAHLCRSGQSQIIEVRDGETVAGNAEVKLRDGTAGLAHGLLADHNGQASPEAQAAVTEWLHLVNTNRLDLAYDLEGDGFVMRTAPVARAGM